MPSSEWQTAVFAAHVDMDGMQIATLALMDYSAMPAGEAAASGVASGGWEPFTFALK